MPRKIRDASLETRTARSRLARRAKPYFRLIQPGLFVGYRKLASGPGTWVAKRYSGDGRYRVDNLRTADGALVIADDHSEPDGKHVLNFAQAQELALADATMERQTGNRATSSSYTVAEALEDYLSFLASDGRSDAAVRDARYRSRMCILPTLGSQKVSSLTTDQLRCWRDDLVKKAPPLHTRGGDDQKYRAITLADDAALRARRATANRIDDIERGAQPCVQRRQGRFRHRLAPGQALSRRRPRAHPLSLDRRGQAPRQRLRPRVPAGPASRAANRRTLRPDCRARRFGLRSRCRDHTVSDP